MTEINPVNTSGHNTSRAKVSKTKENGMKESLFTMLDSNKDGQISKEELKSAGYQGEDLVALNEAMFKAERSVNKWMRIDLNRNGTTDNIEDAIWNKHNTDDGHIDGDLSPEEFAKKYNLEKFSNYQGRDFEEWCKIWIEDENPMVGVKSWMKKQYGKDLNEAETRLLYDVMKSQANRWLFKENALYERLNLDAYTRLVTPEQTVSCCGGDVSKPPIGPQNPDEGCAIIFRGLTDYDGSNSSFDTKNRLAWAAFKTIPQDEVLKMTPEEYKVYQAEWQKVRNMKASDYRNLLKPENKEKLEKFEQNSNMTVQQIVDYIDIVESSTGQDFDSNDWTIDSQTFFEEIMPKINGTYGDDTILEGKTRLDIPPEKQNWLNYLEQHDLLLEQFKE